ncbi:MAG: type II toxin-antitoxin system YafQ family toxin [Ruminococcus sp.]|jgi:mRNA interferase YafQ|nr:type II toxin-antitoxin system YafQ family toxin [Ruminococcus sp.]
MTKYTVVPTSEYKRNRKKAEKRGLDMDFLDWIVAELADGKTLPQKHKDHKLKGDRRGDRECHITPDWLLIYRYENDELLLVLRELNSHSNLF